MTPKYFTLFIFVSFIKYSNCKSKCFKVNHFKAIPILIPVSLSGLIPEVFDGIGIGQVCYTSTNSVVGPLIINTVYSKLSS